ncbi:MAG: hypothetical protein U0Y96_09490 [Candidatus Kapaibacterium sp.]
MEVVHHIKGDVQQYVEQLWKVVKRSGEILIAVQDDSAILQKKVAYLENEIESKNASIHSLTTSLDELKDEISHIDELRAAMKALYEKNHDAQSVINDRNSEIQRLVAETQEQHEKLVTAEKYQLLNTELDQKLQKSINDTQILEEKLSKYETLEQDYIIAQDEMSALKTVILRKEAEIEEQILNAKKLEDKVNELHVTIADSEKLYTEYEQLKHDNAEQQKQIQDLQSQIEIQHRSAVDYKEQVDELTEKMFVSERKLQEALSWSKQLEESLQNNSENDALKIRETELLGKINTLESVVTEGINRFSKKLALANNGDITGTSIERWQTIVDTFVSSFDTTQKRIVELEDLIESNNIQIQQLQQQVTKTEHANASNLEMQNLLEDIAALRRELELSELAGLQQKEQVAEQTETIIDLKNRIDEKESAYIKLKLEYDDDVEDYDKKLKRVEKEKDELYKQLQLSRNRIIDVEDELRFELERNIALKKELIATDVDDTSIIKDFEKEISRLKDEREYYIQQLNVLGETHTNIVQHISSNQSNTELSLLSHQLKETILNIRKGIEAGIDNSTVKGIVANRQELIDKIHSMSQRLESIL